ncbi:MAG: hypothetical protein HYZ52_02360 [Candidatus Omnitrophica bacterium]|nr:hypothetical protein [Candidatus Omnitrophota bacterium]
MGQVLSSALDSAGRIRSWLLNSGIQNLSRDRRAHGGFSAWYELDSDLYPFLYSEITGYAITTLVYLHTLKKDPLLVERAEQAAEWLGRCARLPRGGVRTRYYLVPHYETPNYSFDRGRVYTFDTAIVGYGLLQLHKVTRKRLYLKWAREMTDFILFKMARPDGLFHPYYDSRTNRPGEDFEKWSDQAGSFHAKVALLFIDLWRQTGESHLKDAAGRLLRACLKLQKASGRFVTNLEDDSTHLHPHCYTLEGLVYAYHHLGHHELAAPLRRGMAWLLKAVGDDGSISTFYKNRRFDFHERSDIVAQALRIGSLLYGLNVYRTPGLSSVLERIRRHLELFIYRRPSGQKGGVLYGAATDGLVRMHLNAWCGMFAIQSIVMHESFVGRKRKVSLEHLI